MKILRRVKDGPESRVDAFFLIGGPWSRTWREYDPTADQLATLTHGRKVLS